MSKKNKSVDAVEKKEVETVKQEQNVEVKEPKEKFFKRVGNKIGTTTKNAVSFVKKNAGKIVVGGVGLAAGAYGLYELGKRHAGSEESDSCFETGTDEVLFVDENITTDEE